ncbi:MAG TPA: thioredoxin domain-containing protein [Gemmatimonadaceae bacterium]
MSRSQLKPPVGEHDHIEGSEDAPLTLVEYGDYECPHCARAYPIIKDLQERMGDRMRFVYRNFPLREAHPQAEHAAEAAEWAGDSGKFWEMHDALFEHRSDGPGWLDDDRLAQYASDLGLDPDDLQRAFLEERYRPRVRSDFMSGVRSGVNGTPTFFINGSRYDGSWEVDDLMDALEGAGASR